MRIGGQTVGRFLGWRPSSHVDAAGVVYAPHDQSRISGTQFIHAGVSLTVSKLKLMVDSWLMKDTSKTFLDLPRLDSFQDRRLAELRRSLPLRTPWERPRYVR